MTRFADDFKERVFWVWYTKSKPNPQRLLNELVLVEGEDDVPAASTLQTWIVEWKERADELDQQAKDQFTSEVIGNKVDMLRRHASIGKELQEIGLEWLRENKDELTAHTVARLIKDGYEIERASVGVPEALEKMLSTSDEELIKQIEAAITDEDLDLLNASK
jgi:hypothetical protein